MKSSARIAAERLLARFGTLVALTIIAAFVFYGR
jgi:hypothetical protein